MSTATQIIKTLMFIQGYGGKISGDLITTNEGNSIQAKLVMDGQRYFLFAFQ